MSPPQLPLLPPVAPLPELLKVLVGPPVNDVILTPSTVVPDDKVYIDDTPKLSARTYASLIITPAISLEKQKVLVAEFNIYLTEKRKNYNSLFLTNYRESKSSARKRISFELVYNIVQYILER